MPATVKSDEEAFARLTWEVEREKMSKERGTWKKQTGEQ